MFSVGPPPLTRRSDERRLHRRFPLSLYVDYRLLNRGRVDLLGSARTINLASGGVLLEADASLVTGRQIELFISWPMLLERVCPLNLVMRGKITRSHGQVVAVQASQYEFRTAGVRPADTNKNEPKVRGGRV